MGIFNALSTAVTGLSAQSYALENISGNIANSQTVGFKRVDTSFVDLIPDAPSRHEIAGSVVSYSQLTNTVQGALKSTGITTNMALNGNGYFVVQQNTGSSSAPLFNGQNLYTRRGDFTTDASGYLVNGSGKYLVGSVAGQANSPIRISNAPVPAHQTTKINYQANLPSYPKTQSSDPTVTGSELLSASLASGSTVSAADASTFVDQSLNGGDVTVYDSAGTAVAVQTRWAKVSSSSSGGTDTWQLYYQSDSKATGTSPAYTKIDSFSFDSAGRLTSSGTANLSPLVVNGNTIGNVTMTFGTGGLTQYSAPSTRTATRPALSPPSACRATGGSRAATRTGRSRRSPRSWSRTSPATTR